MCNTGRLNQVISESVAALLEMFGEKRPEEFEVPLGELSGMTIFAGWGPPLPVRVMAAGAVRVEPKVAFVTAGINQVAHRIYLDVEVEMMVVAPFVHNPIVVRQPVILAEQILPGDVPSTYVHLVGYSGDSRSGSPSNRHWNRGEQLGDVLAGAGRMASMS